MSKKEFKEVKELAQNIILSCLQEQFVHYADRAFLASLNNDFKKELLYLMLSMEALEKIIDAR